jgi:integrase/recombinase XerD
VRAFTKTELLALLAAAKAKGDRDWLICLVGYWHGLRASEITGITTDQLRGGYLTVQRLKGSLKTTQPLIPHEDPLLNEKLALPEFTKNVPTGQRIFPISRVQLFRIFQKAAAAAGLPDHKRHPHLLKHSIAMHMIKAGVSIEIVRQWLGHRSMSSTGEYLKVSDDEAADEMIAALGAAHV